MTPKAPLRYRAISLLVALGLALLGLIGCADNRQLNYRALVLAMGFAPAAHGRIKVLFQIPTPSGLTSLSGGSGSSASSSLSTFTVEGVGQTVARAFTKAQADVNQDLYLGQLQAVIFSTQLTSAQFTDIASTLTRFGTLDKTAYALATQAPVTDVLQTVSKTTPMAPLYYSTEFGCAHCQTVNLKREIWSIEQQQYAPPVVNLWFPLIMPTTSGFRIDHVVFYQNNRATTILTPHQTVMFGYALGKTSKGTIQLHWQGDPVSVRGLKASAHVFARWQGPTLHLQQTLSISGDVDTFPLSVPVKPLLPWVIARVQQKVGAESLALLQSLSRRGIDPFHVGQAYVWQHPGELTKWQRAYPKAHWTVKVKIRIRELGDST